MMFTALRQTTRRVLWDSDFDNIDFFGSLFLMGWGMWFLMPWDLSSIGQVYIYMESILSESVWGYILLSIGLIRLAALVIDHFHDVLWFRMGAIIGTFLFWVFLCALLAQGAYGSSLVFITAFSSMISLWETVRVIQKKTLRSDIKATRP